MRLNAMVDCFDFGDISDFKAYCRRECEKAPKLQPVLALIWR